MTCPHCGQHIPDINAINQEFLVTRAVLAAQASESLYPSQEQIRILLERVASNAGCQDSPGRWGR